MGAEWWSVVQVVAWIVERSDDAVERAARAKLVRSLEQLVPGLRPRSTTDDPPVTLAAAPAELLRTARARRITIYGRRGPDGPRPIAIGPEFRLSDRGGRISLGDEQMHRVGHVWIDLSVRADECKACWPPPAIVATGATESQVEPRADDETIKAWMGGEIVRRRNTDEPRDRDSMALAARLEFPGLGSTRSKELYAALDNKLKGKRGPKNRDPRKRDKGRRISGQNN